MFVIGRLQVVAAPAKGVETIMKLTVEFSLEELIALAVVSTLAMKFLTQQ